MNVVFGETVTVLRRPSRDRTGDGVPAVHHTISGCAFFWGPVTENDDRRETSLIGAGVFVPDGSDVLPSDHIQRADGTTYNVEGVPQWSGAVHPFTGWRPGYVLVNLKAVM